MLGLDRREILRPTAMGLLWSIVAFILASTTGLGVVAFYLVAIPAGVVEGMRRVDR